MTNEFYPADWKQIADLIKESNGYTCQSCGVECRREPTDRSKPVLTIAHYDNVYEASWVLLVPLCVQCHLVHDAPFGWHARRRHARVRMRQAGQLTMELLPEERGV